MEELNGAFGLRRRATETALKLILEPGEIGFCTNDRTVWVKDFNDGFIQLGGGKVFDVKDYGARGNGVANDSLAIYNCFDAARQNGGGVINFPYGIYLVDYGFWWPDNTVIKLNGSKLLCSTTFATGSIPSEGIPNAILLASGALGATTLTRDFEKFILIGDGGTLDGNILNHSVAETDVPGYSGIGIETSDGQIEANYLRVKKVIVCDLNIDRVRHYGIYSQNAEDIIFQNVKVGQSGANGVSVISGRNVHFARVQANHTRGPNPEDTSYGAGFWHETTRPWQKLENIVHTDCSAAYNYGSGFNLCNNGQDIDTDVYALRCKTYRNAWDTATQAYRNYVPAAGFFVGLGANYTARHYVEISDCVAVEEYGAGFKVQRFAGGQTNSLVKINNPTSLHCNQRNVDSYERCGVSVVNANPYDPITQEELYEAFTPDVPMARVEINNPSVVSPPSNTLGYLIGIQYSENVYLKNPTYFGPGTYNGVFGNLPTNRFTSGVQNAVFDFGVDTGDGILGDASKFLEPARLATFHETEEPDDIHTNEAVVWVDDDDIFTLIFNDNTGVKKYLNFLDSKPLRATSSYGGSTLAAGDVVGANITVTGASMGMHVKVSYSANLNNGGSGPEIFAFVSAADTVRWVIANHALVSRTILAGDIYVLVEDIT